MIAIKPLPLDQLVSAGTFTYVLAGLTHTEDLEVFIPQIPEKEEDSRATDEANDQVNRQLMEAYDLLAREGATQVRFLENPRNTTFA